MNLYFIKMLSATELEHCLCWYALFEVIRSKHREEFSSLTTICAQAEIKRDAGQELSDLLTPPNSH